MSIDLRPDDEAVAVAARTATFVREVVAPLERERHGSLHHADDAFRRSLQDQAKAAGVFAPHAPVDRGGLGIDRRGQALVFEEAGWSLFGPLALNIAAPDEGNMHLLEHAADEAQQQRYLAPLVQGDIRSCFAMTEPAPGAGSDPSLLCTTATPVAGGWRIDGRKWFITGAVGADFAICMARTSGEAGDRGGATMFLVPMTTPGVVVERAIGTLDEGMIGGHAELRFDDCRVPHDAVLGEVDRGFDYAQVRLAPARLTHCMRWLGIARRAHEIAMQHACERRAFGQELGQLGMVQQMVADSEIDLAASRALVVQAAWELDLGLEAGTSTSVAKVFVSEAVGRIVDRAVQTCGALAISDDVLLSRFYREVRAFRIYDGPSETHRMAIARRALRAAGREGVGG